MRFAIKYIISPLLFIAVFSCHQITERKAGYTIHGIDISRHQKEVAWNEINKEQIHFAFIKATEGRELVDKYFCTNWNQLGEKGIKKGAYHFFRPSISPAEQFQNYSKEVSLSEGDLPPVLDFEATGDLSDADIQQSLHTLLGLLQEHYQVQPIVYTNLKMYNKYIAGNFDEHPIWIARYSDKMPLLHKGKSWTFWQYGNRGRVPGIHGDVDLNVFHGSMEELNSFGVPNL